MQDIKQLEESCQYFLGRVRELERDGQRPLDANQVRAFSDQDTVDLGDERLERLHPVEVQHLERDLLLLGLGRHDDVDACTRLMRSATTCPKGASCTSSVMVPSPMSYSR